MRHYIVQKMSFKQHALHSRDSYGQIRLLVATSHQAGIELTPGNVMMTMSLVTGYQAMSNLNEEIVQEYLPCEDEVAQLYLEQ